ncbi:MAG: VCBS repeat-containing protein, partial [Phycisphaerae bacterium]|nr:VCBS repeat-containing protein [Phycisphaerae bacterium]
MPIVALLVVALGCVPRSGDDAASMRFVDVAAQVGLDGAGAPRLCVADVDADGRPDLVLDRTRVMLNRAANADAGGGSAPSPPGFLFLEVESRLEHPGVDGVSIFADLDGDAIPDAIVVRSRGAAAWQRGRGDGSFDDAAPLEGARPGTVAAIAAGDADRDGRTDLFVTHWYRAYGERLDADPADLLLQRRDESGAIRFERHPLPEDDAEFDEERDAGGRPIYGALIAQLVDASEAPPPQLIELAYGRRWNRLYARRAPAADGASSEREWVDRAPALGFDGDEDRSGTYPPWLRERAATDPRFDRTDEKPFRSNGNTFDASIGDLDGDGRFDAVLAEITHAWAGPSSDRSRVLVRRGDRFESPPEWSLDRIPSDDSDQARRWNQGDLFVELADFDLDGRLDLALASGDYPDPPPFDERLRILLQRSEGDAAAPSDGPRDA